VKKLCFSFVLPNCLAPRQAISSPHAAKTYAPIACPTTTVGNRSVSKAYPSHLFCQIARLHAKQFPAPQTREMDIKKPGPKEYLCPRAQQLLSK
jgi:hypothetical protein